MFFVACLDAKKTTTSYIKIITLSQNAESEKNVHIKLHQLKSEALAYDGFASRFLLPVEAEEYRNL